MANLPWTDAEDKRLAALLNEGCSYGLAMEMMEQEGFPARSRHAAISRAARLGYGVAGARPARRLPNPGTCRTGNTKAGNSNPGRHDTGGVGTSDGVVPKRLPVRKRAQPAKKQAAPAAGAVAFFDLRTGHCRWPQWGDRESPPVADRMFCGRTVRASSSYCPACHGLSITPRADGGLERRAGSYARHDGVSPRGPRAAREDGPGAEYEADLVDVLAGAA